MKKQYKIILGVAVVIGLLGASFAIKEESTVNITKPKTKIQKFMDSVDDDRSLKELREAFGSISDDSPFHDHGSFEDFPGEFVVVKRVAEMF